MLPRHACQADSIWETRKENVERSHCTGNIWDSNLQGRTAAHTLLEERAETLVSESSQSIELVLERTLNILTFLWSRNDGAGGTEILFLVPDKLLGKR